METPRRCCLPSAIQWMTPKEVFPPRRHPSGRNLIAFKSGEKPPKFSSRGTQQMATHAILSVIPGIRTRDGRETPLANYERNYTAAP